MNTAPHPLTLAGKLCSMGSIGPDDLAAITPDTPRITVLLEDGQAVHLVGLTREHIQGMAPMFFEPVRIVVQSAEDMPDGQQYDGRYGGVAGAADSCNPPAPPAISDAQIDAIAEGMPGGLEGFLKTWGYRQFAREVLALRLPPVWAPKFEALGDQERLLAEFCAEIAGPKGKRGSPPDPVRLLEMAEALYRAEAAEAMGLLIRSAQRQETHDSNTIAIYRHAAEVLAEKVQDLQRENIRLRQQISATIPADRQAAARARADAARPIIALPSDEELQDMLLERVEFLTGTDEPMDPEREARDRAACELMHLRICAAMVAILKGIIRDYHYALDLRQPGGIAQGHALDAIRQRLGMPWVQGAELKARTALTVEAAPGIPT